LTAPFVLRAQDTPFGPLQYWYDGEDVCWRRCGSLLVQRMPLQDFDRIVSAPVIAAPRKWPTLGSIVHRVKAAGGSPALVVRLPKVPDGCLYIDHARPIGQPWPTRFNIAFLRYATTLEIDRAYLQVLNLSFGVSAADDRVWETARHAATHILREETEE